MPENGTPPPGETAKRRKGEGEEENPTRRDDDSGVPLERIVSFLDDYLAVHSTPDYPTALNGLQVEAAGPVRTFAVAVDASQRVIDETTPHADLLIVHHGIFWDGLRPLRGPRFRRVRALIESGTALYSAHLPLDGHPEVGNAVAIARALRLRNLNPFGSYKGAPVGWSGRFTEPIPENTVRTELAQVLEGPVGVLPGGPDVVATVGVVTGAGGSLLAEAAERGVDLLITGEANHHHAIEAAEVGVTVLLGGHYATETFGVKALADVVTNRFGIKGRFVDAPTGL